LSNWLAHSDPLKLTAYATIAVAFVGFVSIAANFVLAWQARKSAQASAASLRLQSETVRLQSEELDVLRRQVKLAEDQFAAARDSARPRLLPQIARVGNLFIEGEVAYVHGSEPAYDITIWIRGPSRPGAGWGLYKGVIGFMTGADHQIRFMAAPATANEQAGCPFPEFLEDLQLQARDYFVGTTWRRLDETIEKQSFMQTLSLQEPPGITG
jgi:hypothetical protein